MSRKMPATWVDFKKQFEAHWLTSSFEVEMITKWYNLNVTGCCNLEEYTTKFWNVLLPVESYKKVSLKEQVEKYCCGLPYELRDYCTKSKV